MKKSDCGNFLDEYLMLMVFVDILSIIMVTLAFLLMAFHEWRTSDESKPIDKNIPVVQSYQ